MGLQLIFVVETNKKSMSDWIYIRGTIEHFYSFKPGHVRYIPIYMDGKTKYNDKNLEVKEKIKKYNGASVNNESRVLYCFDCDNYDSNPEDMKFLKTTSQFCAENGYEHVWFCKDIERVYLGRKVQSSQKTQEATKFKANHLIRLVDETKLSASEIGPNKSNLLSIMDNIISSLKDKTLINRK